MLALLLVAARCIVAGGTGVATVATKALVPSTMTMALRRRYQLHRGRPLLGLSATTNLLAAQLRQRQHLLRLRRSRLGHPRPRPLGTSLTLQPVALQALSRLVLVADVGRVQLLVLLLRLQLRPLLTLLPRVSALQHQRQHVMSMADEVAVEAEVAAEGAAVVQLRPRPIHRTR